MGVKGGGGAVTAASGCGGGSRSGGGGCGGSGGGDGATMAAAMGNGDLGEGHQPHVGATSGVALVSLLAAFESGGAHTSGYVWIARGGGGGERPRLLPPPPPPPLASPVCPEYAPSSAHSDGCGCGFTPPAQEGRPSNDLRHPLAVATARGDGGAGGGAGTPLGPRPGGWGRRGWGRCVVRCGVARERRIVWADAARRVGRAAA